jgi:signal transduction histidine kinase
MKDKYEILVVDDDLKNIQVGINFLKQNEEYHLVFATSGQQALERVKEKQFDLVLLDIIMPVMDGYEVCRRLKADHRTKNIPIIFLTAKHEADSLMKGFELGGADYITKPFNAPELNARVKTHLELHHHYKKEIIKLQELLACAQKAETIRFLAGGVTHDCNNFITSIFPSVHMVRSQLSNDGIDISPYRDLFDGINKAASKVSDLLTTYSRFSRNSESTKEIVDLNEVIIELKKVCKGALNNTILLDITFLSQPALVFANKLHVEQVLLNLLINAQHAIKARSDNTRENGRISVTIDKAVDNLSFIPNNEHRYLCISVEDNGIGMTAEIKDRIFEQYFTTRREEGGTGLGLAVSNSIVLSHAGCITVDSQAGRGTKFSIFLPCYSGTDEAIDRT